jgi:glucose-1-phosphate thymidylyltransferase
MRGIVLAGGTGSRLWPITKGTSKQLLPVYDKPMIYYPISTLMLAGIREILIITTSHEQDNFKNLLRDGSQFGMRFQYAIQDKPNGLAEALTIGENFIDKDCCMLILGDNIFHGSGLGNELKDIEGESGARAFIYEVSNASQYGVMDIDSNGKVLSIIEKPTNPKSNLAITGLYYFDSLAIDFAKDTKPSARGEVEITSVLNDYLKLGKLKYTRLSRGTAWLDTGSFDSLHDASTFIRVMQERTGLQIACLEEIAWRNGWITDSQLKEISKREKSQSTKNYLESLFSYPNNGFNHGE